MIEHLRVLEASNDNYPKKLLEQRRENAQREQRKRELIEHSSYIQQVREWIKGVKTDMSSFDLSEDPSDDVQAVAAALSTLETAVMEADNALDKAEREPSSSEALAIAQKAISMLAGTFEEAQHIVDDEE